jgi:hypothetical protein
MNGVENDLEKYYIITEFPTVLLYKKENPLEPIKWRPEGEKTKEKLILFLE